jgi:SAM-dependent methyltransferase
VGVYGHDLAVVPVAAAEREDVEVAPCPVCRASRARPAYRLGDLEQRLVVCPGCGLGRLHPMPDEATVRSYYEGLYYGRGGRKFGALEESLVRLGARRLARQLARGLRPGDRVLDVGCGRGALLSALADRGLEAHGVEMSEAAAEGVDSRARVRIAWRLADAGYPSGSFRRVVFWHVLEHLRDPEGALLEARRILAADGLLHVAVPNFASPQARWAGPAWFHLDPPRHLWHFPFPALLRLLEGHGFRVVATHHFSLRQDPFGWVQSALNRIPGERRDALYGQLLRGSDTGRGARALARRLAYWAGMPPAVVLSALTAAARSGATVHVVARPALQGDA